MGPLFVGASLPASTGAPAVPVDPPLPPTPVDAPPLPPMPTVVLVVSLVVLAPPDPPLPEVDIVVDVGDPVSIVLTPVVVEPVVVVSFTKFLMILTVSVSVLPQPNRAAANAANSNVKFNDFAMIGSDR